MTTTAIGSFGLVACGGEGTDVCSDPVDCSPGTGYLVTPEEGSYLSILDGSQVVVKNGQGSPTWTYEVEVEVDEDPPAIVLTEQTDGSLTFDPTTFAAPTRLLCLDETETDCLGLNLVGAGPTTTISINPTTQTISSQFGLRVNVTAVEGFEDLPAGCSIGPVSGTISSTNYNSTAGTATLTASGLSLAAVSSCGPHNDLFNGALGLPGTVDLNLLTEVVLDLQNS